MQGKAEKRCNLNNNERKMSVSLLLLASSCHYTVVSVFYTMTTTTTTTTTKHTLLRQQQTTKEERNRPIGTCRTVVVATGKQDQRETSELAALREDATTNDVIAQTSFRVRGKKQSMVARSVRRLKERFEIDIP
jgi:16S rRNA G1207 methylase RsmC